MGALARVAAVAVGYNITLALASLLIPLAVLRAGGGPGGVALASALLNSVFIVTTMVSGKASDAVGARRPFILAGQALMLAGSLALLGHEAASAYTASVLTAAGSGLIAPNLAMLAVEVLGSPRSAVSSVMARYGLASSTGWLVGLVVGAAASAGSLTLTAIASVASASSTAAYAALALPESSVTFEREPIAHARPKLWIAERAKLVFAILIHPPRLAGLSRALRLLGTLFARGVALYLLAVSCAFTGIGAFFTQLVVHFRAEAGMSESEVFRFYAVLSATSMAGYAVMPRLTARYAEERVLMGALIGRALLFLFPAMLPAKHLYVLLLAPALGLTWAAISTNANAVMIRWSEPHKGGERLGELNAASSLGLTVGSLISGPVTSGLGFVWNCAISSLLVLMASVLLGAASRALR